MHINKGNLSKVLAPVAALQTKYLISTAKYTSHLSITVAKMSKQVKDFVGYKF